jgi:hypothetical protein
VADLPQILAGPILRRCTESMITVWLATSIDLKDGLEIALYDASNSKALKAIDATTDHQVVKAGAKLFIHLMVARPKAPPKSSTMGFPRGKLLGYELLVLNESVPEYSLLRKVPLKAFLTTETLDYGTYPWPTFFLQADGAPLRVLHGSCRRAYAAGNDALAAPDTLIRDSLADITSRPTLMILTGDQIYADDVMWAMWSHTSKKAQQIMGFDETAPIDGKLKPLSKIDGRRDLILKNGLTTDDGENHLIGFSEYAAHYLMNWSETLWSDYIPAFGPKGLAESRDLMHVNIFQQTLPAVRRALANVPAYMIFDDHDVTDDWNLDQQWEKETNASDLGRRLITNALYTYWLFQAWGNDPDTFDVKFVARIQAFCDLFNQKAGSPSSADTKDYDDFIRTAVGPETGFGRWPSWSYIVPCTPPIFVLDTRTTRDLRPRDSAPGLIDKRGQEGLKRVLDKAKRQGVLSLSTMPLVMVSATPFWPVQFIDLLQRRSIVHGGSSPSADLEFWRNNLTAHTNILLEITKHYMPSSIVFLSGDVHYGFSCHTALYSGVDPQADVIEKNRTGGKFVDIYQLTSSAFKNENSKVALSRHFYSNVASGLITAVDIDNNWVNYLFNSQGDVQLDGQSFMWALQKMKNSGKSFLLPQIFFMNMVNIRGGPLLMPDYLFTLFNLKVNRQPQWREEVQLYDHSGSSGAYVTDKAHVGLVTFDGQNLTHDLYGVDDLSQHQPSARLLAPKIWGPARVNLRLGR